MVLSQTLPEVTEENRKKQIAGAEIWTRACQSWGSAAKHSTSTFSDRDWSKIHWYRNFHKQL